jgi:hypothetical protein
VFVIDAQGIIRQHTPMLGNVLDQAIDELIEQAESAQREGGARVSNVDQCW